MTEPQVPSEAAEKFLERDFTQCFTQMRHYDGQIVDIVKFTCTIYITIFGVGSGLYQFSKKEDVDLMPVAEAVAIVGFLSGVMMTFLIVRNRMYYAIAARYINEHRQLFLASRPLGFQNKAGMYTSPAKPAYFSWLSSQSMYLYIVAFLNSLILYALGSPYLEWSLNLALAALCFTAHLGIAISYLKTCDSKSAEKAVFGKDGPSRLKMS